MHEHSLCKSLLQQIEAFAQEHKARKVKSVTLDIGPLAGIDPEELRQAFPHNSDGTIAEGAELIVRLIPLRFKCRDCGCESEGDLKHMHCSHCQSDNTRLLDGDQMHIADMELVV
ncbi:MAG: hydrogenase maturation nickel metallochaperone HypA [Gammaproteobacteria bacterium]|nr:hydrogenase maturation nickel metallochaperone HypA [Gammaproteobacteria bacterium]